MFLNQNIKWRWVFGKL